MRRFGTGDWDSDMKNNVDRREFLVGMAVLAGGVAVADVLPEGLARADKPQSLTELTAIVAVTARRNGELKAEDYARALLDRAHQLEDLNAFRTLDREMVREAARAADQARTSGVAVGSLHGLPIPVKDSVNSKTLPTSYGTRAFRDLRPREEAGVLKVLWAQGAILMGKTNLHELSLGWTSNNGIFGPVRNPYDPTRVPGGSSGGSGAAIAARIAPLAAKVRNWAARSIALPLRPLPRRRAQADNQP